MLNSCQPLASPEAMISGQRLFRCKDAHVLEKACDVMSLLVATAQRESFDVIGKVGFGRDFQASKDINSRMNTFQLISDNLEEGIRRVFNPWRKYSRSKVRVQEITTFHTIVF